MAYKLKLKASEVEAMDLEEFQNWMAFLELKSEAEQEALKK